MEIKFSIITDYQFVKGDAGRQKLYWDEVCISMSNLHEELSAPPCIRSRQKQICAEASFQDALQCLERFDSSQVMVKAVKARNYRQP